LLQGSSWEKPIRSSSSAAVLSKKLKRLRGELKRWSKSISKLKMMIENCNKVLLDIDNIEDKRPLFVQEYNFRVILKGHINRLLGYQNKYWKQRCTYRWAQLGDENTKYFHARATERYRHNSIVSVVLDDGRLVDSHAEKVAAFLDSFKSRMGCSHTLVMAFNLSILITRVEGLEALSVPFTSQEIDKVIRLLPADKAPSPDGFNGLFLKVCWEIIKDDFYKFFSNFWEGNISLQCLNNSFITLIPKSSSPETVNDYRPISLLNCVLKVLTKILADRLQKWILKVVHRNQYGFIKGKNIQDCLAWSFEYLHQCKASGREIVIIKLDFAKAFDTIEHSSIMEILKHMGFDDRWLSWMKLIFQSGSSTILINGVPGTEFLCKRGVRQGDPLSPLLFVAGAELLQVAINHACDEGRLSLPIEQPASEDFPVIQYADDTLVVLPAEPAQLATLKTILDA
jgi:hypothetical protein